MSEVERLAKRLTAGWSLELAREGAAELRRLEAECEQLRQALAAHEAAKPAETVAWLHPANASCVTTDPTAYARGIPLYAAPVAQAEPAWMPIETAPKDGSLLLLWERWESEPFIGQWVSSAYGGKWAASRTHYDTDGNACVIDRFYSEGVTHWQPLPPAPKEQQHE